MYKEDGDGEGDHRQDQPLGSPDPDSFNEERNQIHDQDEIKQIKKNQKRGADTRRRKCIHGISSENLTSDII